MSAFAADLPAFFTVGEHAEAVTYTAAGASAVTVNGIFDDAYSEAFADVEGDAPHFTCVASDVPNVAHGDTIKRGTVTYTVVNVRPDGQGLTVLRLRTS